MFCVDVPRVRGKMAEKGYTLTSLSKAIKVSRNTLRTYFDEPGKMPYKVVAALASLLCDTPEEAGYIFFGVNLRKRKNPDPAEN